MVVIKMHDIRPIVVSVVKNIETQNINLILHGGSSGPPLEGYLAWHLSGPTLWLSSYFMTLFLLTFVTSYWGHFSKKNFENLKKRKNVFPQFRHRWVPPLKKKILKIIFFQFFSNKSYFFNLNLNFTCS